MNKAYDLVRSEDGTGWIRTKLLGTHALVMTGLPRICQRCHEAVVISPDSDLFLLAGELHHPECLLSAMADADGGVI